MDDKKQNTKTTEQSANKAHGSNPNANSAGGNPRFRQNGSRPNFRNQPERERSEYDIAIINSSRVTKVTGGGKRMRMSVFTVVGDRKGRIGFGIAKGPDMKVAHEKAVDHAKRNMIKIKMKGTTILHEYTVKFGAAKVMLKPATQGTGIVAGGPVRKVLEIAGIKDVLTKQLGSSNKISNAYAVIKALQFMSK